MAKSKGEHYVDNKAFLQAMIEWKEKCKDAEEADERIPPVTNYIGECFLKIAQHLSYRPNFINYTYKDDMISDGIENCQSFNTMPGDSTSYSIDNSFAIDNLPAEDVYKPKTVEKKSKKGLENFMEDDEIDKVAQLGEER